MMDETVTANRQSLPEAATGRSSPGSSWRLPIASTRAFRATFGVVALLCGAMALTVGYLQWSATVVLDRQLEQGVEAEIRGLSEQYRLGGQARLRTVIAQRSAAPGDALYLLAAGPNRAAVGNLHTITATLWDTVGRAEFVYSRPGPIGPEERLALGSVFRLPDGSRLIVGRDIEDRRTLQRQFRTAMIWSLGAMAAIGVAVALLVSHHLLSRLDALSRSSRRIMAGDLGGRIAANGSGDEFDTLADSLNAMLARLESLVSGYRTVCDDIAHDLKTPITRLRGQAERALLKEKRGDEPQGEDERTAALREIVGEADRLVAVFDGMMRIARLESGAAEARFADVDIGALAADIVDLYEPVFAESGGGLAAAIEPGLPTISGDRQLLAQALTNLLENALTHAGPGPHAAVAVRACADAVEIAVSDDGPGIPPDQRERVLARFVRLDRSRNSPGNGLGLSLAAAVVRHHGGSMSLHAARGAEPLGLEVRIRLPVCGEGRDRRTRPGVLG